MDLFDNYSTCVNGCYLYSTPQDEQLTACPRCGSHKSSNKQFPMLSLSSKLSELIAGSETSERLKYRYENYPRDTVLANARSTNKVYNDIFDSLAYAEVLRKREIDNPLDIYLNLNVDGFQSKVSRTKLTIIHCVVLNYCPTEVKS